MTRPARLTSLAATVLLVGIVVGESRAVRVLALVALAGLAGLVLGWLIVNGLVPVILLVLSWAAAARPG